LSKHIKGVRGEAEGEKKSVTLGDHKALKIFKRGLNFRHNGEKNFDNGIFSGTRQKKMNHLINLHSAWAKKPKVTSLICWGRERLTQRQGQLGKETSWDFRLRNTREALKGQIFAARGGMGDFKLDRRKRHFMKDTGWGEVT